MSWKSSLRNSLRNSPDWLPDIIFFLLHPLFSMLHIWIVCVSVARFHFYGLFLCVILSHKLAKETNLSSNLTSPTVCFSSLFVKFFMFWCRILNFRLCLSALGVFKLLLKHKIPGFRELAEKIWKLNKVQSTIRRLSRQSSSETFTQLLWLYLIHPVQASRGENMQCCKNLPPELFGLFGGLQRGGNRTRSQILKHSKRP